MAKNAETHLGESLTDTSAHMAELLGLNTKPLKVLPPKSKRGKPLHHR